jgi:hypothetical protein
MGLVSSILCISIIFFVLTFTGTNYRSGNLYAFHQNYPEFDNEDDVKDLYEILKNSPHFKSKILRFENITNDVSIGCNVDTLVLDEKKKNDVPTNLQACDEDIQAMKTECDKHYNVMAYCMDKSEFMNSYMVTRNLTHESAGKVAAVVPK